MLMWKRNLAFLGFAFVALAVLATPAPAQDIEGFLKCEICGPAFQQMDLIMACDYGVHDWSNGTVHLLDLNQPAMMQRFRDFEEHDKKMSAQFIKLSDAECSDRLCGGCSEYFAFRRKGLQEERIQTPTGTILITRTEDPALLKEVHAWSAKVREQMASFDPAAFAPATEVIEETACCGTCSSKPAADPMSLLPPEMVEEMKNCTLCKFMLSYPDCMFAAKPDVITLKNGVVFTDTVVDPKNITKYHDFQTAFHGLIEEIEKKDDWNKEDFCSFCWSWAELEKAGALIDWSLTDDGTITVVTSKEPAVIEQIHALAAQVEACCAMFEDYF